MFYVFPCLICLALIVFSTARCYQYNISESVTFRNNFMQFYNDQHNQDIIIDQNNQNPFVPIIPSHCMNSTICEDVPSYPEEYVTVLTKTMPDNIYVESDDVVISKNVLHGFKYTEVCDYMQRNFTPKAAKSVDGKWHYVYNPRNNPRQIFTVELCKGRNSNLPRMAKLLIGYEAVCKQREGIFKMHVFDRRGKLIEKNVQMACCCACVIRRRN